jgi:hypothetical protein
VLASANRYAGVDLCHETPALPLSEEKPSIPSSPIQLDDQQGTDFCFMKGMRS